MKIVAREPEGIVDQMEVVFLSQGGLLRQCGRVGIIVKFLLTQKEYDEFEQYVRDNILNPDKRIKGVWCVDHEKDRPTIKDATFRGIPVLPPYLEE